MMLLLFTIGDERYGIDATQVMKILPLLKLKPLHKTPSYMAGVANYRGRLVPILDISRMYTKNHARSCMSTRIILIKATEKGGGSGVLGILAEKVTDTLKFDKSLVDSFTVRTDKGNMIGEECLINDRVIQLVNVNELLPPYVYQRVFNGDLE